MNRTPLRLPISDTPTLETGIDLYQSTIELLNHQPVDCLHTVNIITLCHAVHNIVHRLVVYDDKSMPNAHWRG